MPDSDNSTEWVKQTSLYRHLTSVKEGINRHKWLESEKAGYDIGWNRASVDWMIHSKR